uniref:RuVC-like Holliday junction resolvase n=1 Tax=Rhinella marina erythrocytic-like virus TaxID=2859906 RepID=A0A8F6UAA5_9VIRU|nr:RuVC-like Holliday junction resolvase [Rhinella marina erythrocytic-like virus]
MDTISFDIGLVNMAYAISSGTTITAFGLMNLKKSTFLKSLNYLSLRLSLLEWTNIKLCLIERQQPRNTKATRLMQHIWTWVRCLYHHVEVKIIAPSHKLKTLGFTGKTYKARKQWAIDNAKYVLQGSLEQAFGNLKKKDDVSDAVLQLIAYLL